MHVRIPQLCSLFQIRHRQPGSAQPFIKLGQLHRAMAVCIRFHHAAHLRVRAHFGADHRIIVRCGVQINFRPCPS